MTGQRKRYSAELKAKVALEAIRGQKRRMKSRLSTGCIRHKLHNGKNKFEELPQSFIVGERKQSKLKRN